MEAHVVVGVDGSSGSRLAVDWAIDEARLRHVSCVLVHGSDAGPMVSGELSFVAGSYDVRHDVAQRMLDAELERVADRGVAVIGALEMSGAVDALIEHSATAALLVVGSHGRGFLGNLLVGSVANACVRHAKCPVVVVPPGWQVKPIGAGSAGSDARSVSAIRARLDEEHRRLTTGLAIIVGELPHAESDTRSIGEIASIDQHEGDVASEVYERERAEGMAADIRNAIGEVAKAYVRVDDGTYGMCEACGELIGDERLEAVPATRYCVAHERQWERSGAELGFLEPAEWPEVELDVDKGDEVVDDDEDWPQSAEEAAMHLERS